MKNGEKIPDYINWVLDVVYQIRMLGEDVLEHMVVAKILRSLTHDFKHVVSYIVEAKDLSKPTMEELSGSLKSHEAILHISAEPEEEAAFQAATNFPVNTGGRRGRGRGRSLFTGHFCGRGRGRTEDNIFKGDSSRQHQRPNIQCFEANVAEETQEGEEESLLFMVAKNSRENTGETWLIDSGCSNHMSGNKGLSTDLKDVSQQTFVPQLAHNLLGVGQLMSSGYKVDFDDGECHIIHKNTNTLFARIEVVNSSPRICEVLQTQWHTTSALSFVFVSTEWRCRVKKSNSHGDGAVYAK
ncbi:uncharacterized protein LOC120268418 [Dioscorea cayenensis subsp. rotundata]|uniref:Uncharacterized protein LOC120268418 n=1 Tax=Dioscorea cayennensis subsp. rotundata TaxID=55577 RepID=A0AB40BXX9_DIOCR|nr:uncharacterized protein LOC120268418 [Dioscorea cayenensis subsp. rotundata]